MKASPPDARREHRAAVANAIALGYESDVSPLADALLVDLIVTQQRAAKALERIADSLERASAVSREHLDDRAAS